MLADFFSSSSIKALDIVKPFLIVGIFPAGTGPYLCLFIAYQIHHPYRSRVSFIDDRQFRAIKAPGYGLPGKEQHILITGRERGLLTIDFGFITTVGVGRP